MKKLLPLFFGLCLYGSQASGQTLIHYWNFNNSADEAKLLTPNSAVSGSSLVHIPGTNSGNFTSAIPLTGNTTGQGFETTNPNARNGDAAGAHLRFNNPVAGKLVFSVPTTGYKNIVVKYATRRSGQGANNQIIEYSINGVDYINYATIQPVDGNPTLQTIDLSAVTAANNNPSLKIRISFSQGAGGLEGNNRFDNFSVDGDLDGVDTNAPVASFTPLNNATSVAVTTLPTITFNEDIRLADNSALNNTNVDNVLELRLNNAAGATVPFDASISGKVITITPLSAFANNQIYYVALKAGTVEDLNDNAISAVQSTSFTTIPFSFNTKISFKDKFVSVNEDAGTATINLVLENPSAASVQLVLKTAPFSNTDYADLTYTTTTINITESSSLAQTITIPITDDTQSEMDEYFVLSLENLNGVSLTGKPYLTVYIKDNDRKAPVATEEVKLNYVGNFKPNTTTGSTTEIVVHDATTQRLFMSSAGQDRLDIADFSNPAAISLIKSIDMKPYGGITSVAVKNGIVAVASPATPEDQDGSVVLFNTNGDFQKQLTVGALPDMITFSPDGTKIMTANEGQPNTSYTIDPEGSVSIIDISGGLASVDQSKVTTLLFTAFNIQEAGLIASGVRKTKASSTLSQDLEPEYVTISADSKKAWVALQENNAVAEIDLEAKAIISLWGLGKKDFNQTGSGLDASDNSGKIHISNYPVKSFYMPDGMANYSVAGKTYLVTANEGDEKEYGSFVERTTVGAVTLDAAAFPNAAVLKEEHNIGRLRITNLDGDTDGDGDYDELMMVGARSFSIFDASTKAQVYDSKDDFELITSQHPVFSAQFNADSEGNGLKSRSRSKGPEPEGLTIATINGSTYAFVGLERIGGVMVYNITDPANVKFVDYKNNRSTTVYNRDVYDYAPEGIIYIAKNQSPDGKAYVVVANEISGTVTVFGLEGSILPVEMLGFDAKLQNNGEVKLTWATASETNNSHFIIERSHDGKNFSKLQKINSKGNSANDYVFADKYPQPGRNYYRLIQTDKDGTESKPWFATADAGLLATSNGFNVYPNPFSGSVIRVQTDNSLSKADVLLSDIAGKQVYAGSANINSGLLEIKLQNKLQAGTYVLKVAGLGAQKLIVQD